jgi:RTX calcium-binding nonapeptide repeat (4 copies)/Beta-propeller repeat
MQNSLIPSFTVALYNPGSDVATGQRPNQVIWERTGNGIIIGIQPVPPYPNPNAPNSIDILIGDFAIDDPAFRQWEDTFVLGDWESPYYANKGLDDLGVILDFNPDQDSIQLHGSANNYQLVDAGLGTTILFQTPTGLDPIGFVLGASNLSLDANYFEFRGTNPPPGPVVPQVRQLGTLGIDSARGVATDASGNVYVAGATTGSIGATNAGLFDGFIVKYDNQGNQLFSRQLGTSGFEDIFGIETDNQGNFYVSGFTDSALGGPKQAQDVDAFVAKYDNNGNQLWIRQVGQNIQFPTFSLAVDANTGDVFISGPDVRASIENPDDAYVIKFDTNGNQQWQTEVGTSGFLNFDESYGVTVGNDGSVYATGWTNGNLGATNQGLYDNWLAKYDNTTGEVQWISQYGTSDYEWSWSVATDSQNNVYTTGWTLGNLEGQNAGSYDAYLTKFDSQGNLLWIQQFGTAEDDEARDIYIDNNDNIFLTGFTRGSLGGTNAGSFDTFVAKFDTDGNQDWITQFGSPDREEPISIAGDDFGNIYVAGGTQGSLGSFNAGSFDAWTAKLDAASGSLQNFNGTPVNPPSQEPQTFNGTPGDDVIDTRNTNSDVIVYGYEGNNTVFTGAGNDQINSASGNDRIRSGAGDDIIYAGDGNNIVDAGAGNNSVFAGFGNDEISAGNGNDIINVGEGNNIINAGAGNNSVFTGFGNDNITTGGGNDTIYAGEGNNIINAGAGNNSVFTGFGNDVITTGAGDDLINAGEGNNTIMAGTGNDTVYVGSGADRFILDAGIGSVIIYGFTSNDSVSRGGGIPDSQNLTLSISGSDTLISAGDDLLAILKWTQQSTVNVV